MPHSARHTRAQHSPLTLVRTRTSVSFRWTYLLMLPTMLMLPMTPLFAGTASAQDAASIAAAGATVTDQSAIPESAPQAGASSADSSTETDATTSAIAPAAQDEAATAGTSDPQDASSSATASNDAAITDMANAANSAPSADEPKIPAAEPELVPVLSEAPPAAATAVTPPSVAAIAAEKPLAKSAEPYNVPIVVDAKVEGHMRFFHSTIHDKFEKWLHRLSHYHPIVERIFSEFGLPTDLVYLSLVESGFNPHAYSRARATGPWQFMKGTGLVYGLRVDKYVDERRDPVKSTVAAARYLRDLYDLFGSWPLAMAAYNAGEGKVMRALHKSQSESFAEIAETRLIRRETKEYVPRFMAATVIAKNPSQYGFNIQAVDPHEFEEVVVGRSLHLRGIASASGVSYETLRLLNPELRLEATPPDDPQYHLKVPVGSKAKVEQVLDRVPAWKAPPEPRIVKVKSSTVRSHSSHKTYRVRTGDTLASIAKRFHLSISALKERNNLSSGHVRKGELLSIH